MEETRYVLTGINKYGERKEILVKNRPNDFTKKVFSYLYDIKIVTVYKAKLNFLESEEI